MSNSFEHHAGFESNDPDGPLHSSGPNLFGDTPTEHARRKPRKNALYFQHITSEMEFAYSYRDQVRDAHTEMAQPYGRRLADGFRLMGVGNA